MSAETPKRAALKARTDAGTMVAARLAATVEDLTGRAVHGLSVAELTKRLGFERAGGGIL